LRTFSNSCLLSIHTIFNRGILKQLPPIADDKFEQELRKEFPVIWWTTLFGPFILTGLIIFLYYFFQGKLFTYKLMGTAFVTFFFFGRFVILGGSDPELAEIQKFFSSEFLLAMVIYMDTMVATIFIFHAGFLFKIPWLGSILSEIAEDGQFILKRHPWIRRAAFLGLIVFVSFPLAATGSVGGAILSRILGMGKLRAFFAIIAGSIFGCSMMYFGSQIINRYLSRDNPFVISSGIAIVALIIILLNVWYRRLKAREYGL
jgi:uncharacterized membrane protein